jgi:hypothetical protein
VSKFNVYNFGGLLPSRIEFDLQLAYKVSLPHIPILITIPNGENRFVNKTIELDKFATENNVKLIVTSLSKSCQDYEIKRIYNAIKDSIKNGNWIIIDNAHLIDEWPQEILQLIYV